MLIREVCETVWGNQIEGDEDEDKKSGRVCEAFKASGMQDLYSHSHQLHNIPQYNCYSHDHGDHHDFMVLSSKTLIHDFVRLKKLTCKIVIL